MDLNWLSIREMHEGLKAGQFSAVELAQACLDQIAKTEDLNCFVTLTPELALAQAKRVDAKLSSGDELGILEGVPGGLKDLFNTKGVRTTSCSNMLKPYVSPYDATIVRLLNEAGYVPLGKQNMDDGACGVSTERSNIGPSKNPWNKDYVPGGSSGGSSASVAAGQMPFAIGSDTGGSVRQPASLCGVVGFKPTYGRISRFGVNAMSSSYDTVGPFARTVEDIAILMNVLAGQDSYDATTPAIEVPDYTQNLSKGVAGMTIGIPKEFFGEGVEPEVREAVMEAVKSYESMGAKIKEVSLPMTKYGVAVYYVLTPGELSTNLARLDGLRFGHKTEHPVKDLTEFYERSRGEGFGDEIKRRVMIGTFVLSAGYADAYYKQAQRVRTLVIREFEEIFKKVDVLVSPVSPTPGFKLGSKINDPLAMYLMDALTIPAASAGIPAISLPCGFSSEGLPIGLQVMGPQFDESKVLQVAAAYEQAHEWYKMRPEL